MKSVAGALAVVAAVVVTAGAAAAQPPSTTDPSAGQTISVEVRSPVIGTLEVIPPTGTSTTGLTVRTSAGCSAQANGFSVLLYGTGVFADGVVMLEPTDAGFSTTGPITAALSRTLAEAAAALDAELIAGAYRLVLVCLDRAAGKAHGMFVGDVHMTSPTSYQTTPPPTPTTTVPPPTTTPPPPGGKPGGLSDTGAAVGALVVTGLGLSVLGIVFVRMSRRRPSRPTEEN